MFVQHLPYEITLFHFTMSESKVIEFFNGKNCFITGGTGFVGIALIEKILRSIPNVGTIYLLMRPKKGKEIQERLAEIKANSVFEKLKEQKSKEELEQLFSKLCAIAGDVGEKGMGLSTSDRALLCNEANIVFHSAATLDFEGGLKPTVQINLLGTRQVTELCCDMKNLCCLVHVSSAYVNSFLLHAEEQIYPLSEDPEHIIKLVNELNEEQLNDMTPKLLGKHPNTYTFTKQMAEHEIQKCEAKFPCTIVRPSQIGGAWMEPMPGWTISKNGPQGFVMGAAMGVIRRIPMPLNNVCDYIPVDIVVNTLLAAACHVGTVKPDKVEIYQATSSERRPFRWTMVEDQINNNLQKYPLKAAIWYPHLKLLPTYERFKLSAIFVHLLPALILDFVIKITGGRPKLWRMHTNVNKSLERLNTFIFTEWVFPAVKTTELYEWLPQNDKQMFNISLEVLVWQNYFITVVEGVRHYLCKESPRSLPAAKNKNMFLYILHVAFQVRSKRGKDPTQRLEDFVNSPVFDKIRDGKDPQKYFEKIKCLSGDVTHKNLNLTNMELHNLQNTISVVFHMAANVRFDQPLKSALLMNTGGALNVLEVAENFTNLKSFVHVSTAYCHCDETELEERPYEAPHAPRKMLDLVSWMDEDLIKNMTPSLIKASPNTYAYTKCLTEQLVAEFKEKIPVAIARPSIVTASWKEPMPGWVENLNGPTGLLVGAGKGVIRTMHCQADYSADIMPVDISMNNIILVAWQRGISKTNDVQVVNVCKGEENLVSWGQALDIGRKHLYDNPFTICLWYPDGSIKSNYYVHVISVILFHIIPAYLIDFLMLVLRQKPFLVQTQKRIQSGLAVLQYYTTRRWIFHNEKMKKISSCLSEQDRKTFYTDVENMDWNQYILNYVLGARKYCVHEEPHTIPRARKILRRLYIMDCIKNVLLLIFFVWMFWSYAQIIFSGFENIARSTAVILLRIIDNLFKFYFLVKSGIKEIVLYMGYLKGVVYCYCWISSILAGYFGLFCPLFPILIVSNKAYRCVTDLLFTFWQLYPTALLQVLCGIRIHITGDAIIPGTTSLLVMNHRTRTDWNFLWPAVYHATSFGTTVKHNRYLHPLKFVLKDAIRHIPGPGWIMQLSCFVYIKRCWHSDKNRLKNLVDYFSRIKYKYTLVLFPEGTDLTGHTQRGSDRHAEKNNLPKYEYVLHPRTKGFTYLASELLNKNVLDCVYDVTLLYPDTIPQTEKDISKGNFPQIVRMHFKRYNKEVLPTNEDGLKTFIDELWLRKEQSLRDHYENGNFLDGPMLQHLDAREIATALIFWTLLPYIVFYVFLISSVFRKIVIIHTAFLLVLNLFSGGFQDFEMGLYKWKRKVFLNPW
ncbi:uncharacterized protein CBL_02283 [Carabus blaptoides fortunei]